MKAIRSNNIRRNWLAAFLGGSAGAVLPALALANPLGASVVAGAVGFSNPDPQTLLIQQGTGDAIINWQQFSIAGGESVIFEQPSASAAVLNRVVGGISTEILGNLSSNGRVFLVNPQGILFGEGARLEVGALLATTLDINDDDFLAGRYRFAQGDFAATTISNAGLIRAADGGFVVLAADQLHNSGMIATRLGEVLLASGSELSLSLDPEGLVSYALDAASSSGLAQAVNSGLIENAGGIVWLSARSAQSLASAAVNNSGQIRARSLVERAGEIHLLAEAGEVRNDGQLDVSGETAGGSIELRSDQALLIGQGSQISATAVAGSGGSVRLSGAEVQLRGGLGIGAGGTLEVEASDIGIGSCTEVVGCGISLLQGDLATQLGAGVQVNLRASDGINFQPLTNGLLDGRGTAAAGGGLRLSAGRDIRFQQLSDQLLLDGELQAYTEGGAIALGSLNSQRGVRMAASAGHISLGSLSLINPGGSAALSLFASDGVSVGGAIDVQGQLAGLDDRDGFTDFAGASVRIATVNGDIDLQGPVKLLGSVGNAVLGDGSSLSGAELLLDAQFAAIRITGPLTLGGSLGTVTGGDSLRVLGSSLRIHAGLGSARIGAVQQQGQIGSVTAGRFSRVEAATLAVDSYLGDAVLAGGAELQGTIGQSRLGDFAVLSGVAADIRAQFAAVVAEQGLKLDGSLGSVQAGQGSDISAADLQLAAEDFSGREAGALLTPAELPVEPHASGTISINGGISLKGSASQVTAGNDSGIFGASLFSLASGNNQLRGGVLELDGRLDGVTAGDDTYVLAAFGTLLSDSAGIVLDSAAIVNGQVGVSLLGLRAQLTGAALWLDTGGPALSLGSGISVNGRLGSSTGDFGLNINGAYAYLNSFFGTTRVAGDIELGSSIGSVTATGGASITGSQLLSGAGFDSGYSNDLLIAGSIRQQASIGSLNIADPETSSVYSGGVLLDAGSGRVGFGDISADNLFVYFDSDSVIGQSQLNIAGYAELFTPSAAPRLSGDLLDIQAGQLFLSLNTDFTTLSARSSEDLEVFFSDLSAETMRLESGGALQISLSQITAGTLRLGGRAIYSDTESTLQAGALDALASETILLRGSSFVGTGLAEHPGDVVLLRQLATRNADLLPRASRPNAFLSAPTVGIANLALAGDYLQIRSDFVFLGRLEFEQPGTLVHLDPLRNLPLFAESVDARVLGEQASKLPVNRGNIQPNIGSFSSVLGELPAVNTGAQRTATQLNFLVGDELPSLQKLILDSGLRDSTLTIGGSGYRGSIQISDQLAVDVRPSNTNFVLLTSAGILGSERIATNGRVVVLGGQLFRDADAFYQQVIAEFENFQVGIDEFNQPEDPDKVEREGPELDDQQACETAS